MSIVLYFWYSIASESERMGYDHLSRKLQNLTQVLRPLCVHCAAPLIVLCALCYATGIPVLCCVLLPWLCAVTMAVCCYHGCVLLLWLCAVTMAVCCVLSLYVLLLYGLRALCFCPTTACTLPLCTYCLSAQPSLSCHRCSWHIAKYWCLCYSPSQVPSVVDCLLT